MKALYPGSFDPLTLGHMDVIERSAQVADQLIVAVGINSAKTPLIDAQQRVRLIKESVAHLPNVRVELMETTLMAKVRECGVDLVIKGVRDAVDLSSELTQATVNREIGGVETIFMPARGEFSHLSSSLVKELLRWGIDTSRYVPPTIQAFLDENRT